jgi:3-methyl-2-oxobutanoate hydroxymethyltransferase
MTKITVLDFARKKAEHVPIVVVTAYDAATAAVVDGAGVDAILVGDSLGMVVQGHQNTLSVTLDDMIYHTRCVQNASPNAMVIMDLPFGTFQLGPRVAVEASIRGVQEAQAEGVKIEGAGDRLAAIEAVAKADIPVWAHIGLTPQSVHAFGGFRVQGKSPDAAKLLLASARQVEAAGAAAIVLEAMPVDLAQEITASVSIPTIGIGAGPHCDGQVLVYHDVLGWSDEFVPKFVRRYAEAGELQREAIERFAADVRSRAFPDAGESYGSVKPQSAGGEERP